MTEGQGDGKEREEQPRKENDGVKCNVMEPEKSVLRQELGRRCWPVVHSLLTGNLSLTGSSTAVEDKQVPVPSCPLITEGLLTKTCTHLDLCSLNNFL